MWFLYRMSLWGSENIRLHRFSRMIDAETVAVLGYQGLLRGKRLVIPGSDNTMTVLFAKFAPRAAVLKAARFLTQKRSAAAPCCCSCRKTPAACKN